MKTRFTISIAVIAVVIVHLSSMFIGFGYADNTGSFSGEAPESQIDLNYAKVSLYRGDTEVAGPIFENKDIVFTSSVSGNKKTYGISEAVISQGVYALKITGTLDVSSIVMTYSVSGLAAGETKIPLAIALSTNPLNNSPSYQDIDLNGGPMALNIDGGSTAPSLDTPYYVFVKVKPLTGLKNVNNNSQDVTLSFSAIVTDHNSQYVSSGNTFVFKVTELIQVEDEETSVGKVTDGGTESAGGETHPVANLTVNDTQYAVGGGGNETSFSVNVSDGNRFCIEYSASTFYFLFNTGTARVAFEVTYYDGDEVEHKLGYSISSTEWQIIGTSTENGWLGLPSTNGTGDLTRYTSLEALDTANGWIGDAGVHGMSVKVSGAQSGTGQVIAKIILK